MKRLCLPVVAGRRACACASGARREHDIRRPPQWSAGQGAGDSFSSSWMDESTSSSTAPATTRPLPSSTTSRTDGTPRSATRDVRRHHTGSRRTLRRSLPSEQRSLRGSCAPRQLGGGKRWWTLRKRADAGCDRGLGLAFALAILGGARDRRTASWGQDPDGFEAALQRATIRSSVADIAAEPACCLVVACSFKSTSTGHFCLWDAPSRRRSQQDRAAATRTETRWVAGKLSCEPRLRGWAGVSRMCRTHG